MLDVDLEPIRRDVEGLTVHDDHRCGVCGSALCAYRADESGEGSDSDDSRARSHGAGIYRSYRDSSWVFIFWGGYRPPGSGFAGPAPKPAREYARSRRGRRLLSSAVRVDGTARRSRTLSTGGGVAPGARCA